MIEDLTKSMELIEGLDIYYYTEKIEKLKEDKWNLKNGKNELGDADLDLTQDEINKKVASIDIRIKDLEIKKEEFQKVIYEIRAKAREIDQLAEEEELLDQLHADIDYSQKQNLEVYGEKNADLSKGKNRKIWMKETKNLSSPRFKVQKELYKLLKKEANKFKIEDYETLQERIEKGEYGPIKDENTGEITYGYSGGYETIDNFVYKISSEKERQVLHGRWDNEKLNQARENLLSNNGLKLKDEGKEAYTILKSIENIQKERFIKDVNHSELNQAIDYFNKAVLSSKQIDYLEILQVEYGKTRINTTETFNSLETIIKQEKQRLKELMSVAQEHYEKSGMKAKVDSKVRLLEIQELLREKQRLLEEYKGKITAWGYNYATEINQLEMEISKLRYEQIEIIKSNPELNSPEYNVDLGKIEKREKLEEEYIEQKIKNEPKETDVETNFEPQKIETKEELEFDEVVNQEPQIEEEKIEEIEIVGNLSIHRTMHYQGYMREKMMKSELGNIPFSAYLENVAPELTELISLEKQREKNANTIYKDYLVYYASLEEKKYAMSFSDFAKDRYSIENIDLPIEKEEEYDEMISRTR